MGQSVTLKKPNSVVTKTEAQELVSTEQAVRFLLTHKYSDIENYIRDNATTLLEIQDILCLFAKIVKPILREYVKNKLDFAE